MIWPIQSHPLWAKIWPQVYSINSSQNKRHFKSCFNTKMGIQTNKCTSKANLMIKWNFRQAGSGQLQQFCSSGQSHLTTSAQHVTHKACGPGNVSPCPGHAQVVGQVHETTLSRLHPHQTWSHMLPTACICHESVSEFWKKECPSIHKPLQHILVLVHEIAVDWSINEWIKLWLTAIDRSCFWLWLCVISRAVLKMLWVAYFWSTSDQSVTILGFVVVAVVFLCDKLF